MSSTRRMNDGFLHFSEGRKTLLRCMERQTSIDDADADAADRAGRPGRNPLMNRITRGRKCFDFLRPSLFPVPRRES